MLNKFRLLTPGPTPLPERVRLALARDMVHHRKKEFAAVMERVQERLRTLFGTQDTVLPLSCSGTGAMTAAVYSLFAPGQKVLVVEGGKFGQRWREIAVSRGLDVKSIDVPWGQAVQPQDVADALRDDPSLAGVLHSIRKPPQACSIPCGKWPPSRERARPCCWWTESPPWA